MTELKKCPFCNEQVVLRPTVNETNVVCMGEPWCGIRFSVPNDKDLIKKWNTRPIESDLERRLDIARKALEKIANDNYVGMTSEDAIYYGKIATSALEQIQKGE